MCSHGVGAGWETPRVNGIQQPVGSHLLECACLLCAESCQSFKNIHDVGCIELSLINTSCHFTA